FLAPAQAVTMTFTTPTGSTAGGQPVSAQVVFTTGIGTLHIDLTNLQVNPISIIQNLSDLGFTLSSPITGALLTASSGMERTVNADGTFTNGSSVSTGWALEGSPNPTGEALRLHVLGTLIGPAHTIIGPPAGTGLYSAANGSIAGNGPHNPFLAGTVSF